MGLLLLLFCSFRAATTQAALQPTAQQPTALQPNIVLLVVDDWGWANNIWHRAAGQPGNSEFLTPNLASLAEEGLLFDRMYAHKVSARAAPASRPAPRPLLTPTPLSTPASHPVLRPQPRSNSVWQTPYPRHRAGRQSRRPQPQGPGERLPRHTQKHDGHCAKAQKRGVRDPHGWQVALVRGGPPSSLLPHKPLPFTSPPPLPP